MKHGKFKREEKRMISKWDEKTDEQVAEIFVRGESEEKEQAQVTLYQRLHPLLLTKASAMLRLERALEPGDIAQEVFLKLLSRLEDPDKKPVTNIQNFAQTMTHNLCINTLRECKREILVENNIPLQRYQSKSTGDANEDELGEILRSGLSEELRQFLYALPFAAGLSACPRVIWILRMTYGYSIGVIAALLQKDKGTISSHLSGAHKQVQRYLHANGYTLKSVVDDPPAGIYRGPLSDVEFLIERFAKPQVVQVDRSRKSYEQKPKYFKTYIGFKGARTSAAAGELARALLPLDDFIGKNKKGWIISLVLPGPNNYPRKTEGLPLLFMSSDEWTIWREIIKQVLHYRNREKNKPWWREVFYELEEFYPRHFQFQSDEDWLEELWWYSPREYQAIVVAQDNDISLTFDLFPREGAPGSGTFRRHRCMNLPSQLYHGIGTLKRFPTRPHHGLLGLHPHRPYYRLNSTVVPNPSWQYKEDYW